MSMFVIDTSVVVKWFNQDNELEVKKSGKIYNDLITNRISVVVPDLLQIELMNVLIKSKSLSVQDIKEDIVSFLSLPLIIKQSTQSVLELTAEIADSYNITAYDALFVATAKIENCQLISNDQRGHGKIEDGSVLMLGQYK